MTRVNLREANHVAGLENQLTRAEAFLINSYQKLHRLPGDKGAKGEERRFITSGYSAETREQDAAHPALPC
jgi:hypothetical protein